MGWRDTLVLLPYGKAFKEYRRYAHQLIGSKQSMEKFLPAEEYEAALFLQNVMATPGDVREHVRRCVRYS